MLNDEVLRGRYPMLADYTAPLPKPEREIVGRDKEVQSVLAAMLRPEISNVILLAAAGSGKTALVQQTMIQDVERLYLEVDLARMIADLDNTEMMAARIKKLFDEAEQFARTESVELVLFIDEFHQIVQLSSAAVEALKPVLAASGTRGIRVIAATTYDEFNQYVRQNQPLVERLQRINLEPPDESVTIDILAGMSQRYGVINSISDPKSLFSLIYEYTERYMTSQAQPRKSILVLDAMVGWHRLLKVPMDRKLLTKVIEESTGINVAFDVDAVEIRNELDRRVFSQQMATRVVANRLQLAVADLYDHSKPISSFLFAGSTGVGKGTPYDTLIPVFFEDGVVRWKKAGDLVVGDFVFDANGCPEKVLGVFPQEKQQVFEVCLSDGRKLITDGPHLWGTYPMKQDRDRGLTVLSTETLMHRLAEAKSRDTRKMRYSIPMNKAVQWPEAKLPVDPYALGALIADGCLSKTVAPLTISSDDEHIVTKVSKAIGAKDYERVKKIDILGMLPDVINQYSKNRRIPSVYMNASVEQRWALVQGLFDSDGHIGGKDGGRFNVSYSTSSKGLAEDVRMLLYSLGVMCSITYADRSKVNVGGSREYTVHVRSQQNEKYRFFSLPRKLEIADKASKIIQTKPYDTEYVDIISITPLVEKQETICIYVDHPEHLYQAGEFIVTHNTELVKQMGDLLFGDSKGHLIRFDGSEFANSNSLDLFRRQLTERVWAMGHAILLIDEVEKMAAENIRLLLQVLDDGRLTDDNGRQVSFLNTYIVLTTNAGSEIFKTIAQYSSSDDGDGSQLKTRMKEISRSIVETTGNNRFPPELMGRIDALVPFQPLSRETQRKIVSSRIQRLAAEVYAKHQVRLKVSTKVIQYLIEDQGDTDSDAGGARGAIKKLNDEVTTKVAAYINANPYVKNVGVAIDGVLASDHKEILTSDAKVIVSRTAS